MAPRANSIVRVSVSPFDTGVPFCSAHRSACQSKGLEETPLSHWMVRLVGQTSKLYTGTRDHEILIGEHGFGLNLRRVRYKDCFLQDFSAVARVIVERNAHHRSIRNGQHPDAALLKQLRGHVLFNCSNHQRRLGRPELWPHPPYTLSLFYLPHSLAQLVVSEESQKALQALVEPSQVTSSELDSAEDTINRCRGLIGSLDVSRFGERFRNSDIRVGVSAHCTWAGVVVCDARGADLEYFEALELRLQTAWSTAAFIRKWAELLLMNRDLSSGRLTEFAEDVAPLIRRSKRLLDVTASTRDQALFDELVRTSELAREQAGAEEALGDVRQALETSRARGQRTYTLIMESLLAIIAMMQILPLFYQVPFHTFKPVTAIIPVLALITFFILRWYRS